MLDNFENKLSDEMAFEIEKRKLSLKNVVILASIIEKEVGRNSATALTEADLETMEQERRLVASVFYNRLGKNVALQSDATVNYISGKNSRFTTESDRAVDSPYNTYKYPGLPPGPIGNPGLDSIMAAVYPADSDYMYFLNKANGEAVFAKTLEEHNSNRAKYLQ